MKYQRKPEIVDAVQYQPGMEDGFIPTYKPDGTVLSIYPYLDLGEQKHRLYLLDRHPPLWSNSMILTHADGSRSVMSKEEFESKYELVDELKLAEELSPKE